MGGGGGGREFSRGSTGPFSGSPAAPPPPPTNKPAEKKKTKTGGGGGGGERIVSRHHWTCFSVARGLTPRSLHGHFAALTQSIIISSAKRSNETALAAPIRQPGAPARSSKIRRFRLLQQAMTASSRVRGRFGRLPLPPTPYAADTEGLQPYDYGHA